MRKRKPHPLVETASEFVGFTSRQNNNPFLVHAQVNGDFQWDGSFIDSLLEKTAGKGYLPSLNNTTTALQFFLRNEWQRRVPQAGDLVFFAYPTEQGSRLGYQSAHIGVVTATDMWNRHRTFRAIEAQVHSGQPRAPRDNNGIYERARHETDVTVFIRIPDGYFNRPARQTADAEPNPALRTVRPAHLERCVTKEKAASAKPEFRKSVETVQLALASHPATRLQNADRGVFNAKTRAALAAFQRFSGLPITECNGDPTVRTLELLSASPYTLDRFRVDS